MTGAKGKNQSANLGAHGGSMELEITEEYLQELKAAGAVVWQDGAWHLTNGAVAELARMLIYQANTKPKK
jgi:hypothetical protein